MSTNHPPAAPHRATAESRAIATATVIGAGTMGAAIAAHLANAGLQVFLLDMVDPQAAPPSENAQSDPQATDPQTNPRNGIVAAGFERMRNARPAHLYTPALAQRITLGNLEDDLAESVAQSDWIIEAIVERLEPKQALMARLETLAPAHAIISTNTSGLPIREIAAGRSEDFKRRFLGTHFFNPPRYLYLLELIPTLDTDPAIVEQFRVFAIQQLGKGVVICKDTPNFIGNRMISYIISRTMEFAVTEGYTVEETDYLVGPLIGRPRSGLFRLLDVIGIDVMAQINRNLYDLIPHDPDRDALMAPAHRAVWQTLLDAGHLGVKTGQGFFKTVTDDTGNRAFWTLDLAAAQGGTIAYQPPRPADFPALDSVRRAPLVECVRAILQQLDADPADRGARLAWMALAHTLHYAAQRLPEIAGSLQDIDRTMRWGFLWEMGPFELWDALGVEIIAERLRASGLTLPPWLEQMLAQGHTSFYQGAPAGQVYDPGTARYVPTEGEFVQWDMPAVRRKGNSVYTNPSATLHLVPAHGPVPGDEHAQGSSDATAPLLLLEFHSKLNALDPHSLDALEAARDALETDVDGAPVAGLLIANAGVHFCVGANLQHMLDAARSQEWDTLASFINRGQQLFLALRHARRPVVAAPFQRVLGGGVEVVLAAHHVVAQAETYMGLVETSVGLIPGWGGCKELVRRHVRPQLDSAAKALPLGLETVFTTILWAKVSASAHDAMRLGLLAKDDTVAMNPELLIATARARVYTTAPASAPATEDRVYAGGTAARELLQDQIEELHIAGKLSDHDRLIAQKLAWVLCGDGPAGDQSAQTFLDREREAFVSLAGEAKTQDRMAYMLRAGKPLRN